ncbi:MAG: PspC domain-containing protein [Nocardia sp.]|nr:PspC domain-containing protein [Nocardia sp.]
MTASGPAGTSRMRLREQLHHLWRTRPVRRPDRGPIAGVAAGFGRRYDVDPVLVRVAFVISALFGGSGVVLYLAAWLLLPAAGESASPAAALIGRGRGSHSPGRTVVLIVLLVIAMSTTGPIGVGLGGSGAIGFAVMIAGWWLLYLRQPEPPDESTYPSAGDTTTGKFTATGYPGTAFPGGTAWAGAYNQFTTLPDHYSPDSDTAPAQPVPPQPSDAAENTPADGDGTPRDDTADSTEDSAATASDSAAPPSDALSDPSAAPSEESDSDQHAAPGRVSTPFVAPALANSLPGGWDPLGVSPMAWDLPVPATPTPMIAPASERPRSRLTPVVIGLAVLAAAAAGGLAAFGQDWMTPGRIAAVALAVVGFGLLLGGFLRRGHGLMVVLAPLAGFVILASMVGPVQFDRGAMGQHVWTPVAATDLAPDYQITMGNGTLDLRGLRLTSDKTVKVNVRMGHFRVLAPPALRLHTTCTAAMGDVRCPPTDSGPAGGPVLTLDIDVHAGNAEVHRG